jgi:hypothetical protein
MYVVSSVPESECQSTLNAPSYNELIESVRRSEANSFNKSTASPVIDLKLVTVDN